MNTTSIKTTTRRLKFPLKVKLLSVMLVLISASLIFYVSIALKVFTQDKSSYIYESILNKAEMGELLLAERLKKDHSGEKSLSELVDSKKITPSFFTDATLNDETFTQKILFLKDGEVLEVNAREIKKTTDIEKNLIEAEKEKSIMSGVREMNLNGESWLYGFKYNDQFHFYQIVMVTQAKAYAVNDYLINKSLFYGLFVLGFALIASVWLARPLTSQLEKLFSATEKISQGDFNINVNINSSDEVGVLSDSVNSMAQKIIVYMEEMKEKARLENEVAVAQLVQSSFFPANDFSFPKVEISGFYEPATECGGDWWSVIEKDGHLIHFIADATGHGVPAALLTATINCCKTNLMTFLEFKPEMKERPDLILEFINKAVCDAGKDILLTCFVAVIDQKNSKLIYANASHPPAMLFNAQKSDLSKDDFLPLNEHLGPRLGQKTDAHYKTTTVELKSGDTIVFYTDGIIEAENSEKMRFGDRRLVKTLLAHATKNVADLKTSFIKEFKDFTQNEPKKDDRTIVISRVR